MPERVTICEYIRELWPERHNMFVRVHLWNAIGAERRRRIRQVNRYPYPDRFTIPCPRYADPA